MTRQQTPPVVTITLNGKPVEVPAGKRLIDAAKDAAAPKDDAAKDAAPKK